MGDHSSTTPFSPPNQDSTSSPPSDNLSMLYYGLVVVGAAAFVLAVYNVIIIRWCSQERPSSPGPAHGGLVGGLPLSQLQARGYDLAGLSSFRYKKGGSSLDVEQGGGEFDCPVCLSDFEEGQDVRQLRRCHHSFHAPCIDMWLYSHTDCPLCRTPVGVLPAFRQERTAADAELENSREVFLGSGMPVSEFSHM